MLCKAAHSQHVHVIAICKISSVETYVCSMSIGMNATDYHRVFQGPSFGIVPILVRNHELLHGTGSTAASSLASIHVVLGQPAFKHATGVTLPASWGMVLQSLKSISSWMMSTRIILPCSSTRSTFTGTED